MTAEHSLHEEAWDDAAPRPEALVESLRSFGYSPETAIADLLDNSISARATEMKLQFVWEGADSHVAMLDDGDGMSADTLLEAMRPGSISPLVTRAKTDLGRFGLGLKTASFSQARELTVITRGKGDAEPHIRRWDLDLVGSSGQWRLLRTPSQQAKQYIETVREQGGTAVVWTKCDRLIGEVDRDPGKANDRFLAVAENVRRHLGMTFHRFLTGRATRFRGKRSIEVNGNVAIPWDPILEHPATHPLGPVEKIPFRDAPVLIQCFVLPHRSKLSEEQQTLGSGMRGWTAHQGFYVYRDDRLVVAGDWLGVGGAKDEHTKLARIIVDFDASLDLDWQIDVKKSTARPPGVLLDDFKRNATLTRRRAEEVYRHRGNLLITSKHKNDHRLTLVWQEFKLKSGELRLKLNREHPVVKGALAGPVDQRRAVERVLRFVEETIPTGLIGIRLAEALDTKVTPYETNPDELAPLLLFAVETLTKAGVPRAAAYDQLLFIEPFCNFPEIVTAMKDTDE